MEVFWRCSFVLALPLSLLGCGRSPADNSRSPGKSPTLAEVKTDARPRNVQSDLDKVRAADFSILFVGNSHTTFHDLPGLVCRMIEFRHPEKKAYSHVVSVAFLDNVAHDSRCKDELESRPWKFVVLQAQKISMSGKHSYSQKVGIDIAKLAKAKGAIVCFYSEWARKGVAGERERTEKIYQEMADAADVKVALVSKAWELALSERPDLPLHAGDGNHQSALGAFLTACVLYAKITGESPAALAAFPYPDAAEDDRKFLAEIAASLSPGGRFVPK